MSLAQILAALAAVEPAVLAAIEAEAPEIASAAKALYDTVTGIAAQKALDAKTLQEDINAENDLVEDAKFGPAK